MNFDYAIQSIKAKRIVLLIMILLGWFALIAQFYLIIQNRQASVFEIIVRYFSYFTILTNLLVAICCTVLLIDKDFGLRKFFSKPSTLTAIAVYILIVGIIYNTILRPLWKPEGLPKIVDELLHAVIPVWFFIYWIMFVRKQNLKWQQAYLWLIYPVTYTIYTFIHGAVTKYYPYPFINANKIGLQHALINGFLVIAAFYFLSLFLIGIGRIKRKPL